VGARVIVVGDEIPPSPSGGPPSFADAEVWRFADLSWADGKPPAVDVVREDVAEIIFTSGATAEPKGVVITHANILANIVPIEREVLKYRKYGKPFFPIRFLNLLPLSHMFGQVMATFVPPMLPGTVVFIRGYNPADIVEQVKKRRVSVVVSVPKILDVLKEHLIRTIPNAESARGLREDSESSSAAAHARGGGAPRASKNAGGVVGRWWHYRKVHRLFGLKFWAFVVGAAPLDPALEQFWSRLGFLVVQGYGLTETAPIVSLNHPLFGTRQGSVGKPMAGVDVRIAEDGEILVKGENVTSGYFNAPGANAEAFEDGWFHTGDVGEIDGQGRLFIRGRKKEMIVTPEGLNVFPEDIERVVDPLPGVRESAVVGARLGTEERVHAVLLLEPGVDPDDIVRQANAKLEDHQQIRCALVWPGDALPRTEGTRKLKRSAIKVWVESGGQPQTAPVAAGERDFDTLLARFTGSRTFKPGTTVAELGLSSLERIELMASLEDAFQTRLDEGAFVGAKSVADLRKLVEQPSNGGAAAAAPAELFEFPSWNLSAPMRAVRRASLGAVLMPLTRVFAWLRVDGLEHLRDLDGPVIFAANHQSHLDTPVILAALPPAWRYRVATAMAKEFFRAHFFPREHSRREWLTNSLNYYLATGIFNAFPLPQREAGARQTLRYIGESLISRGQSLLIFPEGERSRTGALARFRPGVGMIAARLHVPVIPVRLEGLTTVLGVGYHMARPGRVRVVFGAPLQLEGEDYGALARQVEEAVRALGPKPEARSPEPGVPHKT
jgi:long-chain acyl-CoA synthetase